MKITDLVNSRCFHSMKIIFRISISFRRKNRILRHNYKVTGLTPKTPEDIIDMVASLFEDKIQSIIYDDDSHFLIFSDLGNYGK